MAIFGPKPQVNPFGKMSIFRLFDLLLFIAQKGVFSLQNIVKDIFLAYIADKKSSKMAIFGSKPWVNPYGNISVFRLFGLLVFIAFKGVFFAPKYRKRHFSGLYFLARKTFFHSGIYCKRHFPGLYCLNKKSWKNGHFWTKTMG